MPPRRRRQQHGLERVLGAPALFATAYGNVGSSIYYALGVTAVFALGLTPVVFLIAGVIFAATAATYGRRWTYARTRATAARTGGSSPTSAARLAGPAEPPALPPARPLTRGAAVDPQSGLSWTA